MSPEELQMQRDQRNVIVNHQNSCYSSMLLLYIDMRCLVNQNIQMQPHQSISDQGVQVLNKVCRVEHTIKYNGKGNE